jgi:hypothetical protein
MGLKGYRLWVMGQLDSNVQSPTEDAADAGDAPTPFMMVSTSRSTA